jgi:hypothetical protein
MTLKTWFHLFLHVGCVALLLVQGHRIQQLGREKLDVLTSKTSYEAQLREFLDVALLETNPKVAKISECEAQDCILLGLREKQALDPGTSGRSSFFIYRPDGPLPPTYIRPPLKRAVSHCKQVVGVGPLFMPCCDRIPVMLTWLPI